MGITINDRRTIIDQADSLTGWTGASILNNTQYCEGTASVCTAINIGAGQIYYTPASPIDVSDIMIYIYTQCNAIMLSWTTGSHAMYLSDGTNDMAFHMAGGDREVFKHAEGPVWWQSFLLDAPEASGVYADGSNYYTELNGNLIDLNFHSIAEFGAHFITQSKAIGGGYNCFVDIMRYGNDGLRITGGSGTGPGTFLEIATDDRDIGDLKGYGIIRELGAGTFGVQGPLTFGWDNGNTADSWFEDDGVVVIYEDRRIGNNRYYFNVVGSGTAGAETHFTLTNSILKSGGPYVKCDFSSPGVDELVLTSNLFTDLYNKINFADDVYASGHFITQCTFNTCGQIDPGTVNFNNNTIQDSVNPSGAMVIGASGAANLHDLTFISGPSGHAIYMPTSGTYELIDFTYNGYGATGTTDAAVFNDSSGVIILQVNGGDSPTYRNGVGSTTYIQNSVNLTVTVKDSNNQKITGASVAIYSSDNIVEGEHIMNEYTNAQGVATESYNYVGDEEITIRIRKSSTGSTRYFPIQTTGKIESTGFTLTAVMSEDNIVET